MPSPANGLGLLSAYKQYGQKASSYLRPSAESVMTSYAGYPVASAQSEGLANWFATPRGMRNAGMAIGEGSNNIDGPMRIVINPYYFPNSPRGNIQKNALIRLEAARHKMVEPGFKMPDFKITPELQKWREKTFNKDDPYYSDDKAFKESVISRIMVGDTGSDPDNPMPIPKGADLAAQQVMDTLESEDKKRRPLLSEILKKLTFK